jgi:hypothetical protein
MHSPSLSFGCLGDYVFARGYYLGYFQACLLHESSEFLHREQVVVSAVNFSTSLHAALLSCFLGLLLAQGHFTGRQTVLQQRFWTAVDLLLVLIAQHSEIECAVPCHHSRCLPKRLQTGLPAGHMVQDCYQQDPVEDVGSKAKAQAIHVEGVLDGSHSPASLHSKIKDVISYMSFVFTIAATEIGHQLTLPQVLFEVCCHFRNDLVMEVEAEAVVGRVDVLLFNTGWGEDCQLL